MARLAASDWGARRPRDLARQSPLSMACTLELVRLARAEPGVEAALAREFRFTARSLSDGDLLEGIRAQVIDKDRDPQWRDAIDGVRPAQIAAMLAPLGADELIWELRPAQRRRACRSASSGSATWARRWRATSPRPGMRSPALTSPGVRRGRGPGRHRRRGGARPRRGDHHAARRRDPARGLRRDRARPRATGAALIDCSTVDVASARAAAGEAEAAGLLRASTRRSPAASPGAAAGALTFMAGGSAAAFAAARPLFEIMGARAVHCGASGAGQAAKICNNMILGVSMIAVCEAFALADRLGLDRQAMFDVVSTSSGSCWSVNDLLPRPRRRARRARPTTATAPASRPS